MYDFRDELTYVKYVWELAIGRLKANCPEVAKRFNKDISKVDKKLLDLIEKICDEAGAKDD